MAASETEQSPAQAALPATVAQSTNARGFLQDLERALRNLVTLKVVTVVGDVTVTSGDGVLSVAPRDGAATEAASTAVDLLNGHITNIVSPKFADAGGGTLQAFHQSQVEKSNAIMAANLAELQKLAAALIATRR